MSEPVVAIQSIDLDPMVTSEEVVVKIVQILGLSEPKYFCLYEVDPDQGAALPLLVAHLLACLLADIGRELTICTAKTQYQT